MTSVLSIPDIMFYLGYAVILISLGIVFANVIAETGIFSRLNRISGPFCRMSGLSEACVMSILMMMVNATAGKSMLAEFYRDGKVSKDEIIPSLLMGTFPVVIGESLFRVHIPTAIILLGPVVGGMYVLFKLFASLIQTIAAIIYSRWVLNRRNRYESPCNIENPSRKEGSNSNRSKISAGWKKALPSLKRVVPATILAILIFSLLLATGIMDLIGVFFRPFLGIIGLPGESTAALAAQFLHFSAGYAIVASLMAEGVLGLKEALITLIIGSMLTITMIYIKYSFPLYLSLFGRNGMRITLITYSSSMIARSISILLIILLL